MKLYNTLTKKIENFEPLDGRTVRLYSCGPTVYNRVHIGNLSSFIFADSLHRELSASGHKLKHVMNFTDVDDKTIARSRERYSDLDPMTALTKLTEEYSDTFLQDMRLVGNDTETLDFVAATDSITGMQKLITQLHEDGFAYIAEDGIYFSIEAYRKSGKAYGQLTEITASSTSESRIQNDEYDKESAHDFALWKKQKPGEPAWDFRLDDQDLRGRPGWHIECSTMSSAKLGQPFDIHTGGVDLVFPHHENEIAQSTAGKADPLYARFFLHNEHLLVDGQKMSKSLHNFYTLKDIQDKGYDPLAFRLLVLQAHYRTQAHFTWENLEAAQNRLNSYRALADLKWQLPKTSSSNPLYNHTLEEIKKHLYNDLNTPLALAALSTFSDDMKAATSDQTGFNAFLEELDKLLGLGLSSRPDITDDQKAHIAQREQARQAQDWARSDQLRDELLAQGLHLRDTPQGTIWFRP